MALPNLSRVTTFYRVILWALNMVIGYINVTQEVNNNKCMDQLFNMLIGVQTPFEKSEVTFAIIECSFQPESSWVHVISNICNDILQKI